MRKPNSWVSAIALGILAAGCTAPGDPPVGPGAASATDLTPWLKTAPEVTFTGRLQYFNSTSEHGNYLTWSIDPAGQDDAAEVDVRACDGAAAKLVDHWVTITGRLIERGERHFPLLVAEQIESAADQVQPGRPSHVWPAIPLPPAVTTQPSSDVLFVRR